ncbi:hypothetical protein DICVIV_03135 [Dictyocaulus viviparus]|uniref:Uncharacterized protein n=1 Tax=Dictyocaulus viviparus TaxID=29172 RepID=A0A0D8Y1Z3_DICVI|nr:hypothetical protein DICVIV_03135 [Dictyocaulus viviparus]
MALTDTFGSYQNEIGRACADGRQSVLRMKDDVPRMINDMKKTYSRVITDMSEVTVSHKLVIEIFAWSSALVLVNSIGSILGAYILHPIIGNFFGKFTASLCAYFFIPVLCHSGIKRRQRNFESENSIRMMMVIVAAVQGLLAGFAINHRYLAAQPIAFLTPVSLSFGYAGIVDQARRNRVKILGASLGAALAMNLILGALFDLLTLSYMFLTLGYIAIGGITMQLVFDRCHDTSGLVYQNVLCSLFVLFKGLTFHLFGTYIE